MADEGGADPRQRTVLFSPRLYALEAIRSCAERFASAAAIGIVEDAAGIHVSFSPRGGEIDDELVDSFCNHALFETVRRRRERERGAQP